MQKDEAEEFYKSIGELYCPYLKQIVFFNSDGFHHLQFSKGIERKRVEQEFKFKLLKFVPYIVENSGTIQEYRKKDTEYFGFTAINKEFHQQETIKVIIKRVKKNKLIFWSVMPGKRIPK